MLITKQRFRLGSFYNSRETKVSADNCFFLNYENSNRQFRINENWNF